MASPEDQQNARARMALRVILLERVLKPEIDLVRQDVTVYLREHIEAEVEEAERLLALADRMRDRVQTMQSRLQRKRGAGKSDFLAASLTQITDEVARDREVITRSLASMHAVIAEIDNHTYDYVRSLTYGESMPSFFVDD